MRILKKIGYYRIDNTTYYLCINERKKDTVYYLLNSISRSDLKKQIIGEKREDVELKDYKAIRNYATNDYVIEALHFKKTSGESSAAFSGCNNLQKILNLISFVDTYKCRKDSILEEQEFIQDTNKIYHLKVYDKKIDFEYYKVDREFGRFYVKFQEQELFFETGTFPNIKEKEIEFTQISKEVQKNISVASLKKVSYEMLKEMIDLSWYEQDGVLKKDYRSVGSKEEFEDLIMTPLVKSIERLSGTNEKILLSLDTETTGLNIYYLSKDNPDKDTCVAIPIAWEDNKAFVIFTDMEHFPSVPNEYAWGRLKPLLEKIKYEIVDGKVVEKPIEITIYEKEEQKPELQVMDLFGEALDQKREIKRIPRKVKIFRSNIDLTGHNIIYDGKVAFDNGVEPYFDDDSLQLAFDINPNTVRGSVALKGITHRIFNHETPELSDVLGKGNEAMYRYLSDIKVAIIYGCADADYSRAVIKYLRTLVKPDFIKNYKKQDMPLLNILYKSEYFGMKTQAEKVAELAKHSEDNLKILEEFLYRYVGNVIEITKARNVIETKKQAGFYKSEEEYTKALDEMYLNVDKHSRYEFEMKASSIIDVIYNILKYPIFGYTNGRNGTNKRPKTDKYVMKKLVSKKKKEGETGNWDKGWHLSRDIYHAGYTKDDYDSLIKRGEEKAAKEIILISADEFNKCKYPVALVLQKYAELNKDYTSYYKPIREQNMEGRIFKNFNMARIKTRRISNAAQTMKSNLKALVEAHNDDYYLLDFDMSQVEYRIMASLAKHIQIIEKMKDPEKDFHIETASLINNIPAYRITKKLRKEAKSVGFGLPYGLTLQSLCENIFGDKSEEHMIETLKLINKFNKTNVPIIEMLEEKRAEALKERKISVELRDFMDAWKRDYVYDSKGKLISKEYSLDKDGNKIPIPIGMVKNEKGFYRVFDLSNMDSKKESKIKREAGNFPIQSFAAELFRIILIRFHNACCKYGIEDKIVWHMLIHDELLCSVHKSVHPFLMYKIIKEACMVTDVGHTNYFVGINVGNTWQEVKSDEREAPVLFVNEIIKRWDAGEFKETWIDDVWEYVKPYREDFIFRRIYKCIKDIQPDIDDKPINLPLIVDKFTNYTVRSYVIDYYKMNRVIEKIPENASERERLRFEDERWISHFESWVLQWFGEKEAISLSKQKYKIRKSNLFIDVEYEDNYYDDDDDDIFLDEEETWSFDDDGFESGYASDDDDVYDEEEEETRKVIAELHKQINLNNRNAISLAQMVEHKSRYNNIIVNTSYIIVNVKRKQIAEACKKFLAKHITDDGKKVMFKTSLSNFTYGKLNDSFDLSELDKFIDSKQEEMR